MAKSLVRVDPPDPLPREVEGLEHARAALPKAVIAANHASFLDGLLLGAFLPGDPIFAVDTLIAKQWWAKPFLAVRQRAAGRSDQSALDPRDDPRGRSRLGLHHLSGGPHHDDRIVDEGVRRACGHCRAHEGRALPVRIDGVEFTPFSRLAGKVRRRLFPRIRVRILPPRRLTAPEGVTGRARRVALRRALGDEMVQSMFAAARIDTTLFDALVEARQQHGGGHLDRRRSRDAAA